MSLHPLSKFLEPWFAEGEPTLAKLNEAVQLHGVKRGGGLPLRFVRPVTDDLHYEERIFRFGAVATRENNAHDLFNALIWLTFPQTKVVLNRRHVLALREQGSTVRGPLRDALTQFDECGVIVAGTSPELWEAICAHRWHEAFVTRREELCRTTRFIVFGHASHEALISPFNGLCGKALFLPMTEASLARFDHAGNAVWMSCLRTVSPAPTFRHVIGNPCPYSVSLVRRRKTKPPTITPIRASFVPRVQCPREVRQAAAGCQRKCGIWRKVRAP